MPAAAGCALIALGCLTACGSGPDAAAQPTDADTSADAGTSPGAGASVGAVRVTGAFVLAPAGRPIPAGGEAPLFLTVANSAARPDALDRVRMTVTGSDAWIAGGHLSIPAGGRSGSGRIPAIMLPGPQQDESPGASVTVLLHFRNAGSVRVPVPVVARTGRHAGYSPSPARRVSPGPSGHDAVSPSTIAPPSPTSAPAG